MSNKEKITFTTLAMFMGWAMLLCMPRLPEESPASTTQIALYGVFNLLVLVKIQMWVNESR
jgi:uncharacterized protein YhhL (DUF1145 family)